VAFRNYFIRNEQARREGYISSQENEAIPQADRWNRNIHYHAELLRMVPSHARTGLDVGCGQGMLTRQLRQKVPVVVGIDTDALMIEQAAAETDSTSAGISYILGDVMTYPFAEEFFDAIVCVATLHHMDTHAALQRMAELLAPGGTLALLGLARSQLVDLPWNAFGTVATAYFKRRKQFWQHSAPQMWPPRDTFSEVKRIASRVIPGAIYRRRLLFRYTLKWTKPMRPRA
jgi:2-polyprenyl-3-methyl-5-hydroxy-6-metoxy-1,4-benzoquinol methylase